MGWSKAARLGRAEWLPGWLAAGAVGAALLLAGAPSVHPQAWPAAVAVGVFAVSGNAVSMVLVMQRAAPGRAGQDSALVSAGFFAGFALGPPVFGVLAEAGHYGSAWLRVAGKFAAACSVAFMWAVRAAAEHGDCGMMRPDGAGRALSDVLDRGAVTAADVGYQFPLFADSDSGRWITTGRSAWTGGFWAGLLWLRARHTGDPPDRAAASACTARLAPWVEADTATRGLILWYGTALARGDSGAAPPKADPRAPEAPSGVGRPENPVQASLFPAVKRIWRHRSVCRRFLAETGRSAEDEAFQ
ncbi:hypothetical protein ABZ070_32085 [Streptomyces sp. NPDC006283]|uniref:hypothetical protein n=1 Tax=Streptomyces sp. NPDC006283 TaxID=3156741 RepID=UPI0033B3E982